MQERFNAARQARQGGPPLEGHRICHGSRFLRSERHLSSAFPGRCRTLRQGGDDFLVCDLGKIAIELSYGMDFRDLGARLTHIKPVTPGIWHGCSRMENDPGPRRAIAQ